MKKIFLDDIIGGSLQEQFENAFFNVIKNLSDENTPYNAKRQITITFSFSQNIGRDDVKCDVSVVEKLATQSPLCTEFIVTPDGFGRTKILERSKDDFGQYTVNDLDVGSFKVGTEDKDENDGE